MYVADSERLSFRLFNQNDGELLWQLDQDPEVMKYVTNGKPAPWMILIIYFYLD